MKKITSNLTLLVAILAIVSCSKEATNNSTNNTTTCSGTESITFKKDGIQISADTMNWAPIKGTIGGVIRDRNYILALSNSKQVCKIYIEKKLAVGTVTFYFSGNRLGIDSANAYTDYGVFESGSAEITLNADQTICGKFSGIVKPSAAGQPNVSITDGILNKVDMIK